MLRYGDTDSLFIHLFKRYGSPELQDELCDLVRSRHEQLYDYDHYSQKQLAPIADMVLRFFDLDYRSLTKGGRQLSLF